MLNSIVFLWLVFGLVVAWNIDDMHKGIEVSKLYRVSMVLVAFTMWPAALLLTPVVAAVISTKIVRDHKKELAQKEDK